MISSDFDAPGCTLGLPISVELRFQKLVQVLASRTRRALPESGIQQCIERRVPAANRRRISTALEGKKEHRER
ncbi:hypothetical protein ACFFX0_19000 [Citricoccus parietis]|uniref:Uncharacterized protein n=1 Tax=Citricoccus parietis TaxID=592307 RepID=A0ABV5G2L0_9MICC